MFCTVDRRNKAPLIYKIVVSLRNEVHRVIIRIKYDFFSLGKNSIVSSNNKISFHTKGRIRIDTRIHIYISEYCYDYIISIDTLHESNKVLGVRWTLRIVPITLPFSPHRYSTSPKGLSLCRAWNEITDFRVTWWWSRRKNSTVFSK